MENYSRHLTGKLAGEPPDTLLAYFPKNFLTIIDESHIAAPQIRGMYEGDKKKRIFGGIRLAVAFGSGQSPVKI